ncbi:hypothetical protein PG993_003808 [Apiospora rasikravindrae]|uniref:F-box domain-containing protein n=1 Tax=Apiospora rasikravindrae TaxID=990691 RepID=A0ABR1U0K9_9PEZI
MAGNSATPSSEEARHSPSSPSKDPTTRNESTEGSSTRDCQKKLSQEETGLHYGMQKLCSDLARWPEEGYAAEEARAVKRRKKETFAYFCDGYDQIDPNRSTFLGKLPPEVLMEITDFAPISTTVCLTLTCKLAVIVLGRQWWARYRKYVKQGSHAGDPIYDHHRFFLQLLCRDAKHSEYELCARCNVLHPPLKPPTNHIETKLTKSCQGRSIDYRLRSQGGRYNLLLAHVTTAFKLKAFDAQFAVSHLAGADMYRNYYHQCDISTRADWINGNLILRHEYRFSPIHGHDIGVFSILDRPLRLCPHQYTQEEDPPESHGPPDPRHGRHTRIPTAATPNIIADSILSAFGRSPRPRHPNRPVTLEEKEQLGAAKGNAKYLFSCPRCPTKWRVAYEDIGEMGAKQCTVTFFHCFGKDILEARRHFPWLVQRTGSKRESEGKEPLLKSVLVFQVE